MVLMAVIVTGEAVAEQPASAMRGPWIRVNQVGYLPGDPKIAVLSSGQPLQGLFRVGELSASIGSDQGAWGPFAHNYRLDFSVIDKPGRYRIRFEDVESPSFSVGADAYAAVTGALLDFMKTAALRR